MTNALVYKVFVPFYTEESGGEGGNNKPGDNAGKETHVIDCRKKLS